MSLRLIALLTLLAGGITQSALADDYAAAKTQDIKFREGSFYPTWQEERGVEVGVDNFGKREQRRLFGKKVDKFKTIDVAITNNSPVRILLSEFEVFGKKGKVELADLNAVVKDIDPGGGEKGNYRMSILRNELAKKTLKARPINPGETIQGVVFIPKKQLTKTAA